MREQRKTSALWFYQLILLICNISKSGIEKDLRINYCANIKGFTCKCIGVIRVVSLYAHAFKTVKAQELFRFNRVLVCDRVLGTSNSALH